MNPSKGDGTVKLIERDELHEMLDRDEDFKLVMTLGEFAFNAKHIPGSLNITSPFRAAELLDPADEIIVYCSDENCVASIYAYKALDEAGFTNVRRYAGGITDWESAGYALEGKDD
ncbi:MAG: rhodanese-like domain-containing protein [Gaiellaceae bacterium]